MKESIKQKLCVDGLWVMGLKILSFPLGLLMVALMTRMLSAAELGDYFLVASLVEFLVLFSMLGMDKSVVRLLSQALAMELPGRAWQTIRKVLGAGSVAAAVVAVLLLLGIGQFVSEKIFNSALIKELIYYPAIWMMLMTVQRLIAESFRGLHDTRFATVFNGPIPNFLCVVLLALFFWLKIKINLSVTLLVVVASYAVNTLLGYLALHRGVAKKEEGEGTIAFAEIYESSWPLYFTAIFLTGLQQGHLWILGYYSTKESVAVFGAVMRIVVLFAATLQVVRLVIPAMVARLYAQNELKDLEKILRSTASIAGFPSIAGLLLVIIFGKTVLFHLYGKDYISGDPVLVVLSISYIINLMTGAPGVLMIMSSKEKELLKISIISGSLSILLSFILVRQFDYLGVAIGAGFGIAVHNLFMAGYCLKVMRINTFISIKELYNLKKSISEFVTGYKRQVAVKADRL